MHGGERLEYRQQLAFPVSDLVDTSKLSEQMRTVQKIFWMPLGIETFKKFDESSGNMLTSERLEYRQKLG